MEKQNIRKAEIYSLLTMHTLSYNLLSKLRADFSPLASTIVDPLTLFTIPSPPLRLLCLNKPTNRSSATKGIQMSPSKTKMITMA